MLGALLWNVMSCFVQTILNNFIKVSGNCTFSVIMDPLRCHMRVCRESSFHAHVVPLKQCHQ